ncbi:MAG: hypothetical protein AB1Z98_39850 [Nannocystaceae bacterium]
MITVRRSDTGVFVLVHEPSQVVMLGEDLDATYAQLETHLREHPPQIGSTSAGPSAALAAGSAAPSRRAWLVGLGVLALLPFLWLSVLHYSLGRMLDELRTPAASQAELPTKELEGLQTQLHELEQTVQRLEAAQAQSREGEPAGRRRAGRARRPVDQSLVDEPDDAAEDDAAEGDESGDDEPSEPAAPAAQETPEP